MFNTTPKPRQNGLIRQLIAQKFGSISCPEITNVKNKNILITGGNAGIGEQISKELINKGANVTSLSRGVTKGQGSIKNLKTVKADLTDPDSIVKAVEDLGDMQFDILICNAGGVVNTYQKTSLNMEKTYALNVFGQHLLYRLLINKDMLAKDARIVLTTGEIYTIANSCTSDVDDYNKFNVYASSKLGNIWQVLELTKRYPDMHIVGVHPGIVASNFVGKKQGFLSWLRSTLLINEKQGAQSSLIGATQDLPKGCYWNNIVGVVDLPTNDISLDSEKSLQLWDELEEISKPWLN